METLSDGMDITGVGKKKKQKPKCVDGDVH